MIVANIVIGVKNRSTKSSESFDHKIVRPVVRSRSGSRSGDSIDPFAHTFQLWRSMAVRVWLSHIRKFPRS